MNVDSTGLAPIRGRESRSDGLVQDTLYTDVDGTAVGQALLSPRVKMSWLAVQVEFSTPVLCEALRCDLSFGLRQQKL